MAADSAGSALVQLRDTISDLPTIPETLSRILSLLEDPNSGARDLAEVIQGDAPLASKILRLANSPLYQKNRDIKTVQECVAVLGYRTVRQVALCVSVISSLGDECDRRKGTLDYRDLWRHCVATGALARELAKQVSHPEPEAVFTGGLLHDLGKFVMTLSQPQIYAEVIIARAQNGRHLLEVETEVLGYDHAQAGAFLAESWNFPPSLISCIGEHHSEAPVDDGVALVSLADYLANMLDPSASDLGFDAMKADVPQLYSAAGLVRDDVEAQFEELRSSIRAASPLMSLD